MKNTDWAQPMKTLGENLSERNDAFLARLGSPVAPFKKTVRLGTMMSRGGRWISVFCWIEYKADGELTISGVEGPLPSGNAVGSCGQIHNYLAATHINPAPGWTAVTMTRFFMIWDRWHLNNMRAGSPAQRLFVDMLPLDQHHYKKALAALTDAGLSPDPNYMHEGKPYVYGSAWLKETVPQTTLAFLKSLPDTDKPSAWRHL